MATYKMTPDEWLEWQAAFDASDVRERIRRPAYHLVYGLGVARRCDIQSPDGTVVDVVESTEQVQP